MKIHALQELMVYKLDSKMCLSALNAILDISVLVEDPLQMGSAVQVGIVHMELIRQLLKLLMVLIAVGAYVTLDFTALLVVASLYPVPKVCFVVSVASLSLPVHARLGTTASLVPQYQIQPTDSLDIHVHVDNIVKLVLLNRPTVHQVHI